MSVGDSALISGLSYVALGRETTMGTYNTCTSLLPCLSASVITTKENKIIEQIERSRTYSQRSPQMKKIAGDLSFYFQPQVVACNWLLYNAFVGTVTSATAASETLGAGALSGIDHTFNIGEIHQSFGSLCLNIRKGHQSVGKVFQYSGLRVNQITFNAEINDALKCNVALIGLDSTQTTNDVQTTTMQTATSILSFVDGRVSIETSYSSLTTSSFWHVQHVEFGWSNNLKNDAASGRIGSDVLAVLPAGMATFTLKTKIRFDTTTAWNAMINATKLSVQLEFLGPTMPSSQARQRLRMNYPVVYVHNAGEPTISGPNEILTSDVDFHVLRQDDTTAGFALQAIVTNQMPVGSFN